MNPLSLYVFDLDKTLIRGNGSFKFYFFLLSLRFFSPFSIFVSICYFVRHRFFHMSIKELHQKTFRIFLKGKSWEKVQEHVEAFLDKHFEKMLNPSALAHLKKAQKEGHYTLILSSSPSFLVKAIAKRLKVDEWRATEYDVDRTGNFSKILSLILGCEKARHTIAAAHRLKIDRKKIIAFSDSICDLPLLQIAGKAIAVNPDRRLRKTCKRNGWQII